MPLLVPPALPAGALRSIPQPSLPAGDALILRPWQPSDAASARVAFEDPDIQRWHVRRLLDDDEARGWVAGWATRWAQERAASWAIADRRDGTVRGQVGLRNVVLAEGSAEFSYWVLPAFRGSGTAGAAVGAVTAWGFGTLGMHRLYLMHSTVNQPSCRVAEKAGYPYEGTLRGHLRHVDGWHDVHVHGRVSGAGPTVPGV